jgi:ribosome maturation protein SDO1
MADTISSDKIKLNLARIKKFGQTFEINVDPDAALKYKCGETEDLREVLLADNVFSDAKKGLVVSESDLEKAFNTTNTNKIAEIILKEGEIQVTSDHRAEEREQKRKKLVTMIHQQAIDSKTGLPHPVTRIEAALEEARVQLDDHKTVEDQFDDVIAKLRPIIPIKIEQKQADITIPAAYAGKSYNIVSSGSKILNDHWNNDGSWTVKVEVPAGLYPDFLDKINSLTHGKVVVKE